MNSYRHHCWSWITHLGWFWAEEALLPDVFCAANPLQCRTEDYVCASKHMLQHVPFKNHSQGQSCDACLRLSSPQTCFTRDTTVQVTSSSVLFPQISAPLNQAPLPVFHLSDPVSVCCLQVQDQLRAMALERQSRFEQHHDTSQPMDEAIANTHDISKFGKKRAVSSKAGVEVKAPTGETEQR